MLLFLALALALAALVSITFHRTLFKRRRSSAPARADGEDEEDAIKDPNATRPPGVWYPEKFDYPPVEPFPSFDIRTTKPTPYRPFKYGPNYNITMGIRSMKWEEWIEVCPPAGLIVRSLMNSRSTIDSQPSMTFESDDKMKLKGTP